MAVRSAHSDDCGNCAGFIDAELGLGFAFGGWGIVFCWITLWAPLSDTIWEALKCLSPSRLVEIIIRSRVRSLDSIVALKA